MEAYLASIAEWGNDEVMRGMFANLQDLREVNPEAFQEKVRFWQRVIVGAMQRGLLENSVFVLGCRWGEEGARQFQRKGLSPLGLDSVREEMIRAGILRPLPRGKTWSSWLLSFLWGRGQTAWVCMPLLEDYAGRVMAQLKGVVLTDLSSLRELCARLREGEGLPPMSEVDLQLLIEQLVAGGQLGLQAAGDLVRVRQGPMDKMHTTQAQRDLFLLQRTESRLAQQIASLTGQIEGLREEVRLHLRAQDRPLAKHRLQRVKALEALRDTRLRNHATLETILLRVEGARTDADTLQALRLGEQTLRQLLTDQGLQVDSVQVVMGRLEETLADQRQIEETLAQPLAAVEDDYEAELALLMSKTPDEDKISGDKVQIAEMKKMEEEQGESEKELMQRLQQLSIQTPEQPSAPSPPSQIALVE